MPYPSAVSLGLPDRLFTGSHILELSLTDLESYINYETIHSKPYINLVYVSKKNTTRVSTVIYRLLYCSSNKQFSEPLSWYDPITLE